MKLTLNLLGGFALFSPDGLAVSIPRTKAKALLCYLALTAPQPHSRERLCDLLWTSSNPQRAANSLRQLISNLRAWLPDVDRQLLITKNDLALDPAHWSVDVWHLRDAIVSPDQLDRQVWQDRFTGDLLAGLNIAEPAFEEWLLIERRRVAEFTCEVGAMLLAEHARLDHHEIAAQVALKLIDLDPFHEDYHRQAITALVGAGRRKQAHAVYSRLCRLLDDELGVVPEAETASLCEQLGILPQQAIGDTGRAVQHLQQAARLLSNRGRHLQAAKIYGNALELEEHEPAARAQSHDLLLGAYRENFMTGEFGPAEHAARQALMSARARYVDVASIIRAELAMANCARATGRLAESLEYGRNAVVLSGADCDPKLRVRANLSVGTTHFMLGNYSAAFPLLHDNLAILADRNLLIDDEAEPGLPLLRTYGWYIWCCSEMGKFQLGANAAHDAMERATKADDLYSLINCAVALGVLLLHKGEWRQAIEVLRKADENLSSSELTGLTPIVRMPIAMCLAETGDLCSARRVVDSVAVWPDLPIIKAGLAMIKSHLGEFETAKQLAAEGLNRAGKLGTRGDAGWCWLSASGAHHGLGQLSDASHALDQAITISETLGMAPLRKFCDQMQIGA